MESEHPIEQSLRALEAACRAFDSGERGPSADLAAELCRLFHRDGDAPAPLSRPGTRSLHLLSTAEKPPAGTRSWAGLVGWSLHPRDMIFECSPRLDSARTKRQVSLDFWWDGEAIYKHDPFKLRRRDLVLHASGVDDPIPPKYRDLVDGEAWPATMRPPGAPAREVLIYRAPAAMLRQVAYEALHSPELRKLAGR